MLRRTLDIAAGGGATAPFNCSTDSVLVYTRPKTGSSGLMNSFKDLCGCPEETWRNITCGEQRMFKTHVREEVPHYFSLVRNNSRIWMFTLVRDPFKRAPSEYFEGVDLIDKRTQISVEASVDTHIRFFHPWLEASSSSSCSNEFSEAGCFLVQETTYWDGVVNNTGVQLHAGMFDPNQHHLFTSTTLPGNKSLNIILLRLEDAHHWEEVIADYVPGFVFNDRINVAEEKDASANVYSEFKNRFMYSDWERSQILKSDALQFYSAVEVADMLNGSMVAFPR